MEVIVVDLEKAIQAVQETMGITPNKHTNRDASMDCLGIWLKEQYIRSQLNLQVENILKDLEKELHEARSGDLGQIRYPDTFEMFKEDTRKRWARMTKARDIGKDLEEDIQAAQKIIDTTPDHHRSLVDSLNELGDLLGCRYLIKGEDEDLTAAISHHLKALNLPRDNVIGRISAGKRVLRWCAIRQDWQEAYKASDTALRLFPLLGKGDLENTDKQHILGGFGNFVSDAAAAALNAGKDTFTAIEMLELGRSILSESNYKIRTDLSELRKRNPEFSQQFTDIRHQLDVPSLNLDSSNYKDHPLIIQDRFETYRMQRLDANQKLEDLLPQIRQQPGFENFLLALSREEIQTAAADGPIAVINVSTYRCDALLVELHRTRTLELPNISEDTIQKMKWKLVSNVPHVLRWLWDTIAQPVLDALGYTRPCDDDNLLRMWWVLTGPLSTFPMHAAGHHADCPSNAVLDRVMSSYCSSIKELVKSRQNSTPLAVTTASNQALLIGMQDTLGHDRLPFALIEVRKLRDICRQMGLEPIEPRRYKNDILSHLPHCKVFHFAGHGYTDDRDPLQSCLLLEDWKTAEWKSSNGLRIEDLFESNLRENKPFLAFLSACGTGRIKEASLFHESLHLISGFQVAGFRHTIGTLWEVNDEACVDMAAITYQRVLDGGMTDASVCRGLHQASRELRERWLKSLIERTRQSLHEKGCRRQIQKDDMSVMTHTSDEIVERFPRNAELSDEEEEEEEDDDDTDIDDQAALLLWVPYVHFGP